MYASTNKQMNKLLKRLLVAGTDHKLLAFVHSTLLYLSHPAIDHCTLHQHTHEHYQHHHPCRTFIKDSIATPDSLPFQSRHTTTCTWHPPAPNSILSHCQHRLFRIRCSQSSPLNSLCLFSFFYSYLSLASQQNSINLCHIANHCVRTLDEALLMR